METRDLPIYKTQGIVFEVDIENFELREANSEKAISFFSMEQNYNGYSFMYPVQGGLKLLEIPPLVRLDPQGMAKKYRLESVKGMTDFDVIADKQAIDERMQTGRQPTVQIAGELFYVNWHLGQLVRHNDFSGKGLRFESMHRHGNHVHFIYDKDSKLMASLDLKRVTSIESIPSNLIYVRIPNPIHLDAVGYSMSNRFPVGYSLQLAMLRRHTDAEVVPWERTYVAEYLQNSRTQRQPVKLRERMPVRRTRKRL